MAARVLTGSFEFTCSRCGVTGSGEKNLKRGGVTWELSFEDLEA